MSPPNSQEASLFFQWLPPEIRLEIYEHLFYSTRLSFGLRRVQFEGRPRTVRLRPAPNSLALLRVCSRFNDEIGDSWLRQVLFSFEDVGTMLDKLTNLEPQILTKLRHMRFSEQRFITGELPDGGTILERSDYGLSFIFKLLPGLCLDRLTVLGHKSAQSKNLRYFELDHLIKHSNGWKELYYLTNGSEMLGFPFHNWGLHKGPRLRRVPQPSGWNRTLTSRDGPTASVSIYRSSSAADSGALISKPATRQAFTDQSAGPGGDYGGEEDAALMAPGEKEKELLVVARRGKGVSCTETPGFPLRLGEIKECNRGMTWAQICRSGRHWNAPHWPKDEHGGQETWPTVEEGVYKHVDDYEWYPWEFHLDISSGIFNALWCTPW